MYFDRDVACVKRYFERRFKYVSDEPGPFFADAMKATDPERRLDVEVEASGFSKKMAKELEQYVEIVGGDQDGQDASGLTLSSDDGDEEGEEQQEDDTDEEGVQEDPGLVDPGMADSLSNQNDLAVRPLNQADYGLVPFDLPSEHDGITEKVRTKKKATGWAI